MVSLFRAVLIFSVAVLSVPAASAEYSRKVAIAPFTSLAREDVGSTVAVIPRLLASRLMALAEADVLLLPSDGKAPQEAAKEGEYPLLLQGMVSKLGKGYSIDVTAIDVGSGKAAGAFFLAISTEDEIIPRLEVLAGEISERFFGGRTAGKMSAATLPNATVPVPPQSSVPTTAVPSLQQLPTLPPAVPGAQASPLERMAAPVSAQWSPATLRKVSESGMITDEIHGVVVGDVDPKGNGEVIAYGNRILYLYRVREEDLLPHTRISDGLPDHILNVEAVDLDGDGAKELLVTGLDRDSIRSSVWKKKGEIFEKAADRIPYYLIVLPDWLGKAVVVGQEPGSDVPFYGKLCEMSWNGKTLVKGEPLPADARGVPLSSGILGLSSARFGEGWKLVYTDGDNLLRILDANGRTEYKTGKKYGWSGDVFEWGIYLPKTGKNRYAVRKAARVFPGPEGKPMTLVPEGEEKLLSWSGNTKTTRLVLLQWDGGEFVEKVGTPKEGTRTYSGADLLVPSRLEKGGKAIVSIIQLAGDVTGAGISRLALFRIE